jgi:hypothetical protein
MAPRRVGAGSTHLLKAGLSCFVFLLTIVFFSVSSSAAQVEARVRIIEASNKGGTVDPSLKDVHAQLGSLFSFTSYRLLKDETVPIYLRQPVVVPVHPGRSLEMTLLSQPRNAVEMRLRIRRDNTETLNTQVRLSPGRTILIGGPRHGEGVLILALSAK